MSCTINDATVVEWSLKPEHIEEMYQYLYGQVEVGGEIVMDTVTKSSSKIVKSNSGKLDSVDAPDAIVNFHSHPVVCYNNERTVWGWPSGEDMRETLIYGLRGSACHVVPAVEGTYTMQPNPCIISGLINIEKLVDPDLERYAELRKQKNWGDFLRGFVVTTIEIYFRSTHIFRTTDYMKHYPQVSAHDFIDFANIFKLENIFNAHKVKNCSKLGCNEIVKFENKRMTQIPFRKYVEDYEYDTKVFYVDKNGESKQSGSKYLKVLDNGGMDLLQNLTIGTNCTIPVEKWHTAQVFQLVLYDNEVRLHDEWKLYDKLEYDDKLKFLKGQHHEGDIRLKDRDIKFKLFDLKGLCGHGHLKSHVLNYGSLEQEHKGLVRKRSVRKRSGKKSGKRSGKRSGKKSKKRPRKYGRRSVKKSGTIPKSADLKNKDILIIGSVQCSHCSDADKKARSLIKSRKFRYDFKEYPTIEEAVNEAQKMDKTIDSIPAIFVNGKYSPTFQF